MNAEGKINSEYDKITESIQGLFELTARADERLKLFHTRYVEMETKINHISSSQSSLESMMALESLNREQIRHELNTLATQLRELIEKNRELEAGVDVVQNKANKQENRWAAIFDIIVQIGIAIAAAIVIYKMGIPQ